MKRITPRVSALACACLILAAQGPTPADGAKGVSPGRHVLEGPEVSIYNIAGEMTVVQGTGRSVEVEITTAGADGDRLTVEETTVKGVPSLRVLYPENRIVYGPPDGFSSSSFRYGNRKFHVTGRRPGLEAHADIRVLVPRGKRVHLHLAVGRGSVAGVDGDISFEGASSSIQAERVSGALRVDIGSGNIDVSRCQAEVAAETGSGNIAISETDGNLSAQAGSGNIDLKRVGAQSIALDAGSGSIHGSDIRVTNMSADCGSGEISLDGTAAGKLALDAGSGSIHLRLTKNIEDLAIDAGSGSVRLEAPRDLSARFRIECPKRNLHIDFPFESSHIGDDLTEGTIGSGKGKIHIDAGSGEVALVRI